MPSPVVSRPPTLAIALAFGIALAPVVAAPVSARWIAALALAILAARRREYVIVAAVAFGTARGGEPAPAPPTHVDDRGIDRVTGVVTGPIVRGARGNGALLDGDEAVWLWSDRELVPGDYLAASGYLTTPRGSRGPGLPDRALALRARGARYELTALSIERIEAEPDPIAKMWRWAAAVQRRGVVAIDDAGGDPLGSAALRGIALGDRATIPAELDARWRAVGIFHVLSVSGLHLAVIALLCFKWLRKAIAASPWGGRVHPARWAGPPALAIGLAYTLITGGQLATLRALVVVAIIITGAMLDRPMRFVDALAVAAIALLAWRPADLFDPGFQLSFAAALVLALRPREPKGRFVRRFITRPAIVSTWIAIVTAPITAYHFHEVAIGGVVGNVVFTPVLEILALPLSLGGLAIGWDLPVWLASWIVGIVDRLAELLAYVMPIGRIAVASPLTMTVLVALGLALVARARRSWRDGALWLALCAGWALARAPAPDGALRVTFVDVGQGDAAIVELPDGAVWLVDAGGLANARDATAGTAPGRAIGRVLAAYGHDRIDVAIVSHPHPDHYLGLLGVPVPIGELWYVPDEHPGELTRIATTLAARGTRIVHPSLGVAHAQAGVELVTWAPRYEALAGAPLALAADPVRSVNDNSLVVALRFRDRTLLFTGDLENEGESALVSAGLGRVDVVKVAHHGSRTSSTRAFVEATRPALAVISCGRANQFRFPAASVVERWRSVGAEVARTDVHGTITVTIDASGEMSVDRFVP